MYDDNMEKVIILLDEIYLEEERVKRLKNILDRKICELIKDKNFKYALRLLEDTNSCEFKIMQREIEIMMKEEEQN